MNLFISGIIKIVLLEAGVALLLLDRALDERYARARRVAFATLAGLMVFAWANYGMLRGQGVSWVYVMTAVPLVLLVGWLTRAGFDGAETERIAAFRAWARDAGASFKLPHPQRWLAVALSVALVGGWLGLGLQSKSLLLVHQWEQFHFYLGAKYQKEVGWFDLYKAALLADRETLNVSRGVSMTRDLSTFEEVPVEQALADADRVRAAFSPARWEAFKADWVAMVQLWPNDWARVLADHGNSNSPAWSVLAHPLAEWVPLGERSQSALGWLDLLLMLGMWLFVYETFGLRAASVGLLFWAAPPNTFDYLAGSFLRWDWLFCLGMAACFIKRGRWKTAGAFFGFAVATKLFPLWFGVALLIRAGWQWRATRQVRADHVAFLKGTLASGAAAVVLAALLFGASAWPEYAKRIQVAQVEKFYSIQYSLKTVYLQAAESGPGEFLSTFLFPREIKQALPQVDIKSHEAGFLLVRLAFTALVALLLRRADDVQAFTLGPLLVFTWLTVNMYYWNMLGLLALGLATRKERPAFGLLIAFHVIFMFFYLYQHLNRGFAEGYAVAALMCVAIAGAAAWEFREGRLAHG